MAAARYKNMKDWFTRPRASQAALMKERENRTHTGRTSGVGFEREIKISLAHDYVMTKRQKGKWPFGVGRGCYGRTALGLRAESGIRRGCVVRDVNGVLLNA